MLVDLKEVYHKIMGIFLLYEAYKNPSQEFLKLSNFESALRNGTDGIANDDECLF